MKKLLTTITTTLLATSALATPTIYPRDVTLLSAIKNSTTSNIVADDADPNVIWVMPPNSAYSKVGGLHTITANSIFCKKMARISSYTDSIEESIFKLKDRMISAQAEVDVITQKISDARQEYADYIVANNLHDIDKHDDRLALVEEQIANLNDRLNSCTDHCNEISGQLSELRQERTALVKDRRLLAKDRLRSVRIMDQKKESISSYQKDLADAQTKYNKIYTDLESMHSSFMGMYKDFGKMEGARASIDFSSDWDKNIEELGINNPGFDFKQIPTEKAVVRTSLLSVNSLPGDSAILGFELPGKTNDGGVEFPSYPPQFSANLRLSLIGSCPILHPDLFEINLENGTDQMKYGMIVSYEYPTSVEASLQIDYHMKSIYEKIVKSKSKGGFFSSSKKTSITEKNFFKEDFITKWDEQDAGNSYTDEQKADIEKEIRDDMLIRLASNALTTIPNPGVLIAGATGPTGAAVLGASLANNKACQVNKWCMAATVGVNVLNAVFGGSSSAASYTNIQEKRQQVIWSRKKVVMKPWISSYK